jgi:hypothetical protein
MFTATKIDHVADPFGLGFLYTVEFSDGVLVHRYAQEGRTVANVDGSNKKFLVNADSRFRCPSDTVLLKTVNDHLNQFNAIAADSALANGPIDVSTLQSVPPVPLTDEQKQAQADQQAFQQALSQAKQLKDAVDAGAIVDADVLAAAKANLTAALPAVINASTVAALATKLGAASPAIG